MKRTFVLICLLVVSLFNSVQAANLVVPKGLVALNTDNGEALFYRSEYKQAYWPLSIAFLTQENLAYCSIASSVMVLNALAIEAPQDPRYKAYRFFTQDNFFTPQVQQFLKPALVQQRGATLEEIGHALATFPVKVKIIHADQINVAQFRELARAAVASKNDYVIVNFARPGLAEEGGGHMSPLAAYDKVSDRFLLMDVARYKYPPVWVTTEQLWDAMHTFDKGAKVYRGLVVVSKI